MKSRELIERDRQLIKKVEERLPVKLINLTEIQYRLLRDWQHRFFVITSGRRSRKTLICKRKILEKATDINNKYHRYFHAAPTRDQAYRIFWETIKREYKIFKKKVSDSKLFITLYNNTEVHIVGLDKPQRFEGSPWNGGHITEMADIKTGVLNKHVLPGLADTKGFLLMDGVPEGMTQYHDLALYAAGGPLKEPVVGNPVFLENEEYPEWCYYAWHSGDVIDKEELESQAGKLDEITFDQEFGGAFRSYKGLAYGGFSKENFRECGLKRGEVVRIGMDFNVNPMTATLCHVDLRKPEIEQFGEIYLENSNTYEMVDELDERFGIKTLDHRTKREKYIVYPDSTGKAEKSNATMSDLEILKRAGYGIKANSVNPRIKDRINIVNSMICTKEKEGFKRRYHLNPKTCRRTIRDLQKVERLDDGREDKKQEKEGLVHISSALGYMMSYMFPYRTSKVSLK